jgi:hypothetical protein
MTVLNSHYEEACARLDKIIDGLNKVNDALLDELKEYASKAWRENNDGRSRSNGCGCDECKTRPFQWYFYLQNEINQLSMNISNLKTCADEPIQDRIRAINATADLFEGKMTPDDYLTLSLDIHGKPNRIMQLVGAILCILETILFCLVLMPVLLCPLPGSSWLFVETLLLGLAGIGLTAKFLIEDNDAHGLSRGISMIGYSYHSERFNRYSQFFQQPLEESHHPVLAIPYGGSMLLI